MPEAIIDADLSGRLFASQLGEQGFRVEAETLRIFRQEHFGRRSVFFLLLCSYFPTRGDFVELLIADILTLELILNSA